jgi:cystathionine beta-synthase
MEGTGISQLPVIAADGKAVGSVQEVTLARLLHDRRDPNSVKVGDVMARPLPTLEVNTHLDEAYRLLLAGYTGVLATENDAVVDIVTRIDLIHYWDQARRK